MAEKEYIEREALQRCRFIQDEWGEWILAEDIINLPAADVQPVVRGKWYWDKDGMDWGIGAWRCSACKTMSPMWWNCDRGSPMHKSGHKFCPNCGAKMEGN